MEDYSKFQFKGFKIIRSVIERTENEPSKKISLGFAPKGFINKRIVISIAAWCKD